MSDDKAIDWSKEISIDGNIFPPDTLNREKYASYLTGLLKRKGYDQRRGDEAKRTYVLNLNSEWGSGKTYFLRRWSESIKNQHPVVYVNAWEQDYSDDPLMTVITSMIEQLREQAGKSPQDITFKAPRKLLGLLKAATPAIAGGLAKRYLGIDPVKIMESSEDGQIGESIDNEKGDPIDMGMAASKMVTHLLDEHSAKLEAIDSLKKAISQWVEAAKSSSQQSTDRKQFPAFIFIDELDRCRPSYAVEMLETIKHIFNIPGVVFVVATDTEQLQHAVKAIYGQGFDAGVYLGRFFDARYTLKVADYEKLLSVHCDMKSISMQTLSENGITVWPKASIEGVGCNVEIKNISNILTGFNLSAREAIQVVERLISILSNLKEGEIVNFYYLIVLLCLHEKEYGLYGELGSQHVVSGVQSPWSDVCQRHHLNNYNIYLLIDPKNIAGDTIKKHIGRGDYSDVNNPYDDISMPISIRDFFIACHSVGLKWSVGKESEENISRDSNQGNGRSLTNNCLDDWLKYGCYQAEMNKLYCQKADSANQEKHLDHFFDRYKDFVEISTHLES
ncbi:P-loop NTPase fold protein [Salinivibrio kushneri]|uniref:KAP family P-loop NTPase fold protein n=1 Tax=Salinivibrio kushneri TaxID=1908198 RepID=UPI0022B2D066|nr:P-loop NTPase fold protein [Salinivibrio kushneri]WBA18439.1 P-loop NTPase fold protein [Salinivibrio kushneri]